MVCKEVITPVYPIYPFTNHLLTSWDIQVFSMDPMGTQPNPGRIHDSSPSEVRTFGGNSCLDFTQFCPGIPSIFFNGNEALKHPPPPKKMDGK